MSARSEGGRRPTDRVRDEAGVAVPVALGLAGVLVSFALGGLVGGQVLVAQRRAASAADLAALAGAVARQVGRDACDAARRLTELGDAALEECEVDGEQVRVTTGVELTLVGHPVTVRSRAHAGPREISEG